MGNLVRLSDYMLTNAMAQHAIGTSMALLSSLQPHGSARVGHPALMRSCIGFLQPGCSSYTQQ